MGCLKYHLRTPFSMIKESVDLVMCLINSNEIKIDTDTHRVSNIGVPLGLNEIHDNNRMRRTPVVGCRCHASRM